MKSFTKVVALVVLLSLFGFAQQPVNNAQVGGAATATAASGVQKVGIVGSTGTALDGTTAGVLDENVKNVGGNAVSTVASGVAKVGIADSAGNAFTSNSTTTTSKFGLDVNFLDVLGSQIATAATGIIKVGLTDGSGTALTSTGSALDINIKSGAIPAGSNTIGKVDILGNAGAIMDFAGQNAAQPANALLIGGEFNTSPTTITNGNASPLQLDSSGKLLVNCTGCSAGSTVSLVPATSGGLTASHLIAAATNNATSLKASAGQLYGVSLYNNAGYPIFLKFYNKASAPAPATDTVVYEVPAQAGTKVEVHSEIGTVFSTGIAFALVKGIGDTDNTSVAASDATVDLLYK